MSMGGGSTNTVQKSDPWSGAQPYLLDLMSQAQGLYNKGSSYAPFSTVAPFSPTTQLGLQLTQDRALNGSPVIGAADTQVQNLLNPSLQNNPIYGYDNAIASGQTLMSNPYIDSNFHDAAGQIANEVNSQFGSAGRTGSTLNQDTLERNLNNLASTMYGQNYQNETGLQQQAANAIQGAYGQGNQQSLLAATQAPTLANQDYTDLQNLLQAGGAQDQQSQAQLNDLTNRYNYSQQQPWNLLQQYAGIVNGMGGLGGTQTSSQTQPNNNTMSLIGSGLSTAAMLLPFLL